MCATVCDTTKVLLCPLSAAVGLARHTAQRQLTARTRIISPIHLRRHTIAGRADHNTGPSLAPLKYNIEYQISYKQLLYKFFCTCVTKLIYLHTFPDRNNIFHIPYILHQDSSMLTYLFSETDYLNNLTFFLQYFY